MIHRSRWAAELGLAFTCLVWGSTFVLVRNALADVSTVLFLAIRFSLAALLLFALHVLRGGSLRQPGLRAGLATGLLLYSGYLLQTVGLRFTTPAISGFITGLYIVLVPLLAAALYRRQPGASEWLGVALATAGMALLSLQSLRVGSGKGELLTLGCAFAFAAHILALAHYSQKVSAGWLSTLQVATGAAIALLTFWWVEPVFLRPSPALVTAVIITAVFATALAFYVQTWAQARTTPTRAALILSLEPVFAWLASWVLEGEVLTARAVAGVGCILTGILIVELKPLRAR
jgi:drug/metabolite transporter (DMT)-like permease